MKIYTRGGDKGITSLLGGTRVPKDDHRIEAYGTLDELISWIGLLRDNEINTPTSDILLQIQDKLMRLASAISDEKDQLNTLKEITEEDVLILENEIGLMEKELPRLDSFILPGGNTLASYCHISRCVCRRAERRIIPLLKDADDLDIGLKYLNRLSDFLFVLCRKIASDFDVKEIFWKPE